MTRHVPAVLTVEAFQNGKLTRVGPGGVLFMASNQPHNVVNVGDTMAVYHVINWHSPGMLKESAATSQPVASPTVAKDSSTVQGAATSK